MLDSSVDGAGTRGPGEAGRVAGAGVSREKTGTLELTLLFEIVLYTHRAWHRAASSLIFRPLKCSHVSVVATVICTP